MFFCKKLTEVPQKCYSYLQQLFVVICILSGGYIKAVGQDNKLVVSDPLHELHDSLAACRNRKAWSDCSLYSYLIGEELLKVGDKKGAINTFNKGLQDIQHHYSDGNNRFLFVLGEMCVSLVKHGCVYDAAPFFQQKLVYEARAAGGKDNERYLSELSKAAHVMDDAKLYEFSIPLYREEYAIRNTDQRLRGVPYLALLSRMALSFHYQGSDNDAMNTLKEIDATMLGVGANSEDKSVLYAYANMSGQLASLHKGMLHYPEALKYSLYAKNMLERLLLDNSPEYPIVLNTLASTYTLMDSLQTAEKWFNIVLKKREPESKEMAVSLIDYAGLLERKRDTMGAITAYSHAVAILKRIGYTGYTYNIALSNFAAYYASIGNYDSAGKYMLEASSAILSTLNSTFSHMGESDRLQILSRYTGNLLSFFSFAMKANSYGHKENNGWIYDLTLVTKAQVLNSIKKLELYAHASEDTSIRSMYDHWLKSRNELIEKSFRLTKREKDSVQMLIDDKERLLFSAMERTQDKETIVNWKSIRDSLKPGQCAIEFIKFNDVLSHPDSIYYAAMLITKDLDMPVWVLLCEEQALSKVLVNEKNTAINKFIDHIYGNIGNVTTLPVYKLVWEPLEPYLKGIKQIFFSTDGLLSNVSFAALLDRSGKYLIDPENYSLVRVGSTARLTKDALSMHLDEVKNASIFGNVNYNIPGVSEKDFQSWKALPASAAECDSICSILKRKHVQTNVYQKGNATEENFKSLGLNISPSLIYVATHGFFYGEKTHTDTANIKYGRRFKISADPMECSGIVLTGGNYAWVNDKAYKEREDGVLTANELSNINLNNTKLLILSACQSGHGFSLGSEGLYGLQRAIEFSGVEKMIVTLWQIPVRQSSEFMATLFNQWNNGQDLAASFRQTQIMMSKKYDPFYWAGFTLIEN